MRRIKTYSRKDVQVSDTDPWYCFLGQGKTKQIDCADLSPLSEHRGKSSKSSHDDEVQSYCDSSAVLFQSPVENFKSLRKKKVNANCKRRQRQNALKETKLFVKCRKAQDLNTISSSKLNFSEIENFSLVVEPYFERDAKCCFEKTSEILTEYDQNNASSASSVVDKISQCDSYNVVENCSLSSLHCNQPAFHDGIVNNSVSFSSFEPVSPNENAKSNGYGTVGENTYIAQPMPTDLCENSISLERRCLQDIQNTTERANSIMPITKKKNVRKSLLSSFEQSDSSALLFPSGKSKHLLLGKKGKNTKPHCSTPLSVSYRRLSIPLSSVKSKTCRKKMFDPSVSCEIKIDHASMHSRHSRPLPGENCTDSFNSLVCSKTIRECPSPQENCFETTSFKTVCALDSLASEHSNSLDNENNSKFTKGITDACKERNKMQKSNTTEKSFNNVEGSALISSTSLSQMHRLSVQRIIDLNLNKVHSPVSKKLNSSNSKTYCDTVSVLADFFEVSSASLTPKEKIIHFCDQKDVIMFSEAYDWKNIKICKKIGEGSFGEVYRLSSENGKKVVIKVIPVAGEIENNNGHQKTFQEIFSEIAISKSLSEMRNSANNQTRNFTKLNRAWCLKGSVPSKLLDAWANFNKDHSSDSADPGTYSDDQLYAVLEFEHGGSALHEFQLKNPLEGKSVFYQVACTLAVAEEEYSFEHRDLHVGNILVARTSLKYIRYVLNGQKFQLLTHGVLVTVIDFTLSRMSDKGGVIFSDLNSEPSLFKGTGDYQFAVYRIIQQYAENDWRKFIPYSNVLWLHYLAKRLCSYKYLRNSAKSHTEALEFLLKMDKDILQFETAVEVVKEICVFGT